VLTKKPFGLYSLSFKKFCDILNCILNFVSGFFGAVGEVLFEFISFCITVYTVLYNSKES
jgi:hypothetical protein